MESQLICVPYYSIQSTDCWSFDLFGALRSVPSVVLYLIYGDVLVKIDRVLRPVIGTIVRMIVRIFKRNCWSRDSTNWQWTPNLSVAIDPMRNSPECTGAPMGATLPYRVAPISALVHSGELLRGSIVTDGLGVHCQLIDLALKQEIKNGRRTTRSSKGLTRATDGTSRYFKLEYCTNQLINQCMI
jgi:hypothetical protein